MSDIMTTKELACLLGISLRTAQGWIRLGWLPKLSPGGGRGKEGYHSISACYTALLAVQAQTTIYRAIGKFNLQLT